MYSAYNPNPMGARVGDCTVRAISLVPGREAERYLRLALCHRRGRFFFYFVVGRAPKKIIDGNTEYIRKPT